VRIVISFIGASRTLLSLSAQWRGHFITTLAPPGTDLTHSLLRSP